jgi:hypothetical protein
VILFLSVFMFTTLYFPVVLDGQQFTSSFIFQLVTFKERMWILCVSRYGLHLSSRVKAHHDVCWRQDSEV